MSICFYFTHSYGNLKRSLLFLFLQKKLIQCKVLDVVTTAKTKYTSYAHGGV